MAKRVTATGPVDGPWALPDGWRWERLGAVASTVGGGRLKFNKSHYVESGYPAYSAAGQDGLLGQWEFDGEAVVLSSIGARCGKSFYAKERWTSLANTQCIIPNTDLDTRYLWYFTNNEERWERSGSAQPFIKPSTIKSLLIPFPPLKIQRRIVARIDELFAEVDDGEAVLARAGDDLATWRKALLKAAVTGELTADWRATNPCTESGAHLLARSLVERRRQWAAVARNSGKKYKEPVEPELELLGKRPELPRDWTWASAAQLTALVTSGSRGWAEYYSDAGATFIRAQNINSDRLRLDGIAYVMPPKGSEGARTKVSKDDILVTITGANVTKSALVTTDFEEAYVSQHVGLMRPTDPSMAAFLYWWIVTPAGGRAILERLAYGAGKPGLNLPNLSGLPVPLPPLAEQREIARICTSVDVEKAACADAMLEGQQAAATLRQSILTAAFRGDLA